MPKRNFNHKAFTLMEVMVAVMIVSVVIAALLQMRGNTTHKFFGIKEMMKTNQYNSFILSHGNGYGFEKSNTDMYRLIEDFDVENDLRRKLKAIKVELNYVELDVIDTSEYEDSGDDEESETKGSSGIIFEIGKTSLKTKDFKGSLIRIKIQ
ncbi:prepilin-type N-terminal cleavage/methylation domain-containing protein [Sulfurimonas sp. SAG-AH-194-C21]|nr:prepilin-type N-terminal cleavage/methylation domain-containing protein [Sulfurimonas sp. SAG-AH-194-C21]MDF1883047.1 prepilin-type N-terminal cleavage/methylation domain-containing protein [Sulfurimonas sp. SAG-AH-194-C21]